jgi:hypothetical protein
MKKTQSYIEAVEILWQWNKKYKDPFSRDLIFRALTKQPNKFSGTPEGDQISKLSAAIGLSEVYEQMTPEGERLKRDGYTNLETIAPEKIETILLKLKKYEPVKFSEDHRLRYDEKVEIQDLTNPNEMYLFKHENLLEIKEVVDIVLDKRVINTFSSIHGLLPIVTSVSLWGTPAVNGSSASQHWHRDTDCFKFFKRFIYLTDVNLGGGHHEFMTGSHDFEADYIKRTDAEFNFLYLNNRFNSSEVLSKIFKDKPKAFTGPKGTNFLEDTYGYHRGTIPSNGKARVMLSITYSAFPTRLGCKEDQSSFKRNEKLGMLPLSDDEKYVLTLFR